MPASDYEQRFNTSLVPHGLREAYAAALEHEEDDDERKPVGVLETATQFAVSIVVSIIAGRANEGGADQRATLAGARRTLGENGGLIGGLGMTVQTMAALAKLKGVRTLLDPETPLSFEATPASIRFHAVFSELLRQAGGREALLARADEFIAVAERMVVEPPVDDKLPRWYDAVERISQFRNKWIGHWSPGVESLRKVLSECISDACYELSVANPLGQLFASYWDGVVVTDGPERRILCSRGAGRRRMRVPKEAEARLLADDSAWLLEVDQGPDASSSKLVGRFYLSSNTWVVPDDEYEIPIVLDSRGRACVVAGVAAVEGAPGETLVLPVPTDIRVIAELKANTAWGWSRFEVRLDGIEPADEVREYSLAAVQQAMGKYFNGRGLDGELIISLTPPLERPLRMPELATATIVAAARAVADGARKGQTLDDDLQVAILQSVLGPDWHPWRDRLGWLNLARGELHGAAFPTPRADLLLLMPTGASHQRRTVDVRAISGSFPDGEAAPASVSLEDLANWCNETTDRMDRQQPNPNVAVLRHTMAQFGALGIVASPDHWSCGLIFAPGSPGRDAAYRWLNDRHLPHSLQIVRTRTLSQV